MCYSLKTSKFETVVTEMFNRFTQGNGFLQGDTVRLKKSALTSDWFKKQAESVQTRLKEMVADSNRIYRVSTLKSEKPRAAGSFGIDEPLCTTADIVREVNPGFWVDPLTIPTEHLEQVDVGNNMPPYDQDLVRKDTTQIEPEEKGKSTDKVGAKQTEVDDKERNLTTKNQKIAHGQDWDDSKPGAGNTVKGFLRKDRRQKIQK